MIDIILSEGQNCRSDEEMGGSRVWGWNGKMGYFRRRSLWCRTSSASWYMVVVQVLPGLVAQNGRRPTAHRPLPAFSLHYNCAECRLMVEDRWGSRRPSASSSRLSARVTHKCFSFADLSFWTLLNVHLWAWRALLFCFILVLVDLGGILCRDS